MSASGRTSAATASPALMPIDLAPAAALHHAVREVERRRSMASMKTVSTISMPSLIQKFGYSAANAAAISPTRAPATRRPSRATAPMVSVPRTHIR